MSTIPCAKGGHHCSWPACEPDCVGRPGREGKTFLIDMSLAVYVDPDYKEGPDVRMLRCVLQGYRGACPAAVPGACICKDFPAKTYLRLMEDKYGKDDNG